MAFTDLEYQAVKKEVQQFVNSIMPPENVRHELDIVYSISEQTIDIGEQRPVWQGKPGEKNVLPSARIKYIRSLDRWKIYWMRKDMKWHLYSTELSLTDALEVVRVDPDFCFFG
ncbi:DUF3024 domain-containing protein [Enterobacter asburiae]|uniref:DUF3024 domain-containing protein n=1 Tax=Enterobacter asburiae TaxID=61645 RepID=UPI001E4DBE30|nr:DUF3024 domain-containing protein [Enterobacter asburiae]MCE2004071.1 DUF3024 domain-containing protein [Enterobacter asburiae]